MGSKTKGTEVKLSEINAWLKDVELPDGYFSRLITEFDDRARARAGVEVLRGSTMDVQGVVVSYLVPVLSDSPERLTVAFLHAVMMYVSARDDGSLAKRINTHEALLDASWWPVEEA